MKTFFLRLLIAFCPSICLLFSYAFSLKWALCRRRGNEAVMVVFFLFPDTRCLMPAQWRPPLLGCRGGLCPCTAPSPEAVCVGAGAHTCTPSQHCRFLRASTCFSPSGSHVMINVFLFLLCFNFVFSLIFFFSPLCLSPLVSPILPDRSRLRTAAWISLHGPQWLR